MKDDNKRWLLLGIVVLLLFGLSNSQTLPKEAVEHIEGQACSIDSDCPCLGKYNYTESLTDEQATAWGLGVADCKAGVCDTTFCFDVEPVGDWIKQEPVQWAKSNILLTLAILGLLIMAAVWPKA